MDGKNLSQRKQLTKLIAIIIHITTAYKKEFSVTMKVLAYTLERPDLIFSAWAVIIAFGLYFLSPGSTRNNNLANTQSQPTKTYDRSSVPDIPAGSFIYPTFFSSPDNVVPVQTAAGCLTAAQTVFDDFNMMVLDGVCLGPDGEKLGTVKCPQRGHCTITTPRP